MKVPEKLETWFKQSFNFFVSKERDEERAEKGEKREAMCFIQVIEPVLFLFYRVSFTFFFSMLQHSNSH